MRAYLSEFERRRRYLISRVKLYAAASGIIFLAIALAYAVRVSGFFNIRGIDVTGLNGRDTEMLLADLRSAVFRESRTSLLGADNYLSWPGNFDQFSINYRDVRIRKNILSRTISVSAVPRDRFAAWCPVASATRPECRWVDGGEAIFLDTTAVPMGQLIPTITEVTDQNYDPGDAFLNMPEFERLKRILGYLKDFGFSIGTINFNRKLQEIGVTLSDGAFIRFSLRFDPSVNLAGFKEIADGVPTKKIAELNLTVPGKIYLTRR